MIHLYTIHSNTFCFIVHLQKKFISEGLEIAIKKIAPLPSAMDNIPAQTADSKYCIPTSEEIEALINGLESYSPLIRPVYDAVKSATVQGLSLQCVEKYLKIDKNVDANVKQFRNALSKLMNHNPPLIHVVGFEHLRYVSAEYVSDWFLKMDSDRSLLNPLMWNDTSGNIIRLALEGCGNTVISHIATNPGISHVSIVVVNMLPTR